VCHPIGPDCGLNVLKQPHCGILKCKIYEGTLLLCEGSQSSQLPQLAIVPFLCWLLRTGLSSFYHPILPVQQFCCTPSLFSMISFRVSYHMGEPDHDAAIYQLECDLLYTSISCCVLSCTSSAQYTWSY
jgi:hypothetical protein